MMNYMNLEREITPNTLKVLHWILFLLSILGMVVGIIYGFYLKEYAIILMSVLLIPVCYIVLRMYLEFLLIMFKIRDEVYLIAENTHKRGGKNE